FDDLPDLRAERPAPVQAAGGDLADGAAVHAVASPGISGTAGSLPVQRKVLQCKVPDEEQAAVTEYSKNLALKHGLDPQGNVVQAILKEAIAKSDTVQEAKNYLNSQLPVLA